MCQRNIWYSHKKSYETLDKIDANKENNFSRNCEKVQQFNYKNCKLHIILKIVIYCLKFNVMNTLLMKWDYKWWTVCITVNHW